MPREDWPPPPECSHCHAYKATEVFRVSRGDDGGVRYAWAVCNSCCTAYLMDRYGQVLHRADDVRT